MILDESFDSVEKHPNIKSYYNYFIGDQKQGRTSEGQNHWMYKRRLQFITNTVPICTYRVESY